MIPEIYIIRDDEGNEVAAIISKGGNFTIELADNYSVEIPEK